MALLNDAHSETKPFLAIDVEVQPLRYLDLPRAVKNTRAAMAPDSLTRYLAGADRSPALYELRENVLTTVRFATAIHDHRILTIDRGSAICAYGLPGDKPSQLLALLGRLSKVIASQEDTKRRTEVREAMTGLLEAAFGERIKDMIEISSLGTAPEAQGRGYGTALVAAVTQIADEQGRAVYLVTTDAYRFYEYVGFKLVGEQQIAVDNPKWDGTPVTIRIMSREPHTDRVQEKAHLAV